MGGVMVSVLNSHVVNNQKIVEIEAKSILHTVHCPDHMFSPNYIFNS
jgi:hypothetical protein